MSLFIAIIIMVAAGILGGLVNYLLPANTNTETGAKLRGMVSCIVLGFGATFLVPLFLEIAQSKLLDDMHLGFSWQAAAITEKPKPDTVKSKAIYLKVTPADSVKKTKSDTQVIAKPEAAANKPDGSIDKKTSAAGGGADPLKSYLLYGAYCLLAAAAGFKFINMLINNVVKDKELSDKTNKIENLEKEKEKREKNSQISQQQEDMKVRQELTRANLAGMVTTITDTAVPFWPVLPAITHPDDPQKGRFGEKPERNFRELKANVTKSHIPDFYQVEIWVESTDPQHPLDADVVFYLHDSFSPSVYSIKTDEFRNGKALDDDILSYGAFTVGAITDNGKTMLELDLSADPRFPKEFRER